MYVVLNKDTIKNEILSQISVTKCGRVSKAVCMNFISYKLKAEWDCRLRGRRKRKTANALYLVDSPSPCLPPNSGNIMMHTTAWKDVTCDYSFGYVGKFDKKGLYESDLSSCGKRKIVCRRMKNQSQANDFSFGAYFYAVFKSLKKRNIERWRGFFLSRKNLWREGRGENGNNKETTDGLFVVFQSFGIFREPAFQYPFALVEHFEYPPKGRERYDTENNTQVHVFHIEGQTGT